MESLLTLSREEGLSAFHKAHIRYEDLRRLNTENPLLYIAILGENGFSYTETYWQKYDNDGIGPTSTGNQEKDREINRQNNAIHKYRQDLEQAIGLELNKRKADIARIKERRLFLTEELKRKISKLEIEAGVESLLALAEKYTP